MARKNHRRDQRPPELFQEHYLIERELADKLRQASREERSHLYASLYDELFRRVPHHPQLTQKADPKERKKQISDHLNFLGRFLAKETIFMEIGPGDCALSLEVSKRVKQVYAVDVSAEITKVGRYPENFQLLLSDGRAIPLNPDSVQVAYSYHLMEHLHPDDALEQLQNIYQVLSAGGIYICITPNRLNGPHDISMFFTRTAAGFHLKEYTHTDLIGLFRSVGFSKFKTYVRVKGFYFRFPLALIRGCEAILAILPYPLRKPLVQNGFFRIFLAVHLVGIK
ncbi:MAG: methyltransferase domain-containing protein [Pseudomonadota bacterium]